MSKTISLNLTITFLLIIHLSTCIKFYTPDEIFEKLRKAEEGIKPSSFFKNIIEETKNIFQNYAFVNIQKNPPQPKGFEEPYFDKIDIIKEFEKIPTENQTVFDFYSEYVQTVGLLKDLHTSSYINNTIYHYQDYQIFSPVIFEAKHNENLDKPEMYLKISDINESFYEEIKNGVELLKLVKKNYENSISVLYINGQTPFNYIQNFYGHYRNTKSFMCSYVSKLKILNEGTSFNIPPRKEDLKLNITYSNGDTIETEFFIINYLEEASSKNKFDDIFKSNQEIYKKFNEFYTKKINELNDKNYLLQTLKEYYNEFKKEYNIQQNNLFILKDEQNLNIENANEIEWEITGLNEENGTLFQCRVDEDKKANVLKLISFSTDGADYVFENFEKCIFLFDNNDYPLIVIMNYFPGGLGILTDFVVNLVSPLFTTHFVRRVRASNGNYLLTSVGEFSDSYTVETCDVFPVNYTLNPVDVDYGENINEKFIISFHDPILKEKIKEIKNKLKHPKKPNQIIVFTDGFSYSGGSGFIKGLQENGAAIIVGYSGNPEKDIKYFDASQSFSGTAGEHLSKLTYDSVSKLFEYGIGIRGMAYFNNFFDNNEYQIPEEFSVWPINHRMKFYQPYTDDNYNLFVDYGLNISKFNEEKCFYSNLQDSKYALIDDKCTFDYDKNLKGGHICMSDGTYNMNECTPIYCEKGFILDKKTKTCVEDICYRDKEENKSKEEEEVDSIEIFSNESKEDKDKAKLIYLIISCSLAILLITFIILFILACKRKCCFNDKNGKNKLITASSYINDKNDDNAGDLLI